MTTILGVDEDHAALREVLWDLLRQRSSAAQVHRIVDGGSGHDPELDAAFAELGLIGIDAPEDLGGGGGTFSHLRHVAEGCGWAAAATRTLGTSAGGIGALLAGSNVEARTAWVPRLCDGTAGAAVALPGIFSRDRGDGIAAVDTGGAVRLDGRASHVLDLMTADAVIALARTAEDEAVLALVPVGDPTVTLERQEPLDLTRTLGRLTLSGTAVPAAAVLARGVEAQAVVETVVQRLALALAADSLGIAARVLELTVGYAKQREQFERAIGSFQAVKHQAADMLTRTEMARALVDEAGRAYDEGRDDASLLISMAKDLSCAAAAWVAGRGIQLHGGIGYTWEHEMHIYFKRAKLNELLCGDRRWHRTRITELQRNRRG